MEVMQRADEPVKPSWIDYKQIEVLDCKLNEFIEGFNFAEEASNLSKDGGKEVQLFNSVKHDSSFQTGKPPVNFKIANSRKANLSM